MNKITDIILENEGLIYKIIGKYSHYFEIEDLYQVAAMGMIKAYYNYNDSFNTKFTSYAYPYILGEVIKYIIDFRDIKLSKNTKLLYSKILKAKDILTQKLMKEPTIYELSLFLEMDENLISEVMTTNMTATSLDKLLSTDSEDFSLYNKLGYYDNTIENYNLFNELSKLSPEEKQIIMARYYADMTQQEVGNSLGMYQVEVSRKEKKILQKLRDNIAA